MNIEGRNPVLESLRAGQAISKLFIKENITQDEKISEILERAAQLQIPIKYVTRRHLDRIAKTKIHQGVIAKRATEYHTSFSSLIERLRATNKPIFFIYIREAQNEYNVGSIIRSAECVGANGVILPPKTKLSAQMVRASMGASEYIAVSNESVFHAIKIAQENGIKVIGIEVNAAQFYFSEDLQGDVMFIIGGEDKSLSPEILAKCDTTVKIPLQGQVNSLNMSIAASIVMFEKHKQEHLV